MFSYIIHKIILILIFLPLKVSANDINKEVTITLDKGDILNGTLIDAKSSSATKVLDHPQLGELSIGASKIKSLSYDDETAVNKTTDNNNDSRVANSSLSGSINFGFDGDQAHKHYSKSINIDLSGDLTYEKGLYTNTLSFDWVTMKINIKAEKYLILKL